MVKDIELVCDRDMVRFRRSLADCTKDFQDRGLIVEIQYSYHDYRYTALVIGREKNE